jgi:hypothetical protein
MHDPTTRNVSSVYGAPMGRRSGAMRDPTEPAPRSVRLFRVRLDSGGYDAGGAYWGVSGRGAAPLWCATDGVDFEEYVRAGSRAHAAWRLGLEDAQLARPLSRAERDAHATWRAANPEAAERSRMC